MRGFILSFNFFVVLFSINNHIINPIFHPIDEIIDSVDENEQEGIEKDNLHVTCLDSERRLTGTDSTFTFTTNANINTILSSGEVSLCQYTIESNQITCHLSHHNDIGSITLNFYSKDILIDSKSIFFVKSQDDFYYSSSLSLDTAKRMAGISLSYKLIENSNTSRPNQILKQEKSLEIGSSGEVSGVFNWVDNFGNYHPLINAKVILSIEGSWWTSSALTDDFGCYSISYKNIWYIGTGVLTASLYLDNGSSIAVKLNNNTYCYSKCFTDNNGTHDFSYTFKPSVDGDFCFACSIFQFANSYANFAKNINKGLSLPYCYIEYPAEKDNDCYSPAYNTIYLIPDQTLYKTFTCADILGHEYGHHIENCFSFSNNPNGRHYFDENNIETQFTPYHNAPDFHPCSLGEAKDRASRLSWAEGFPTFWSTIAQTSFSQDLKNMPCVNDTKYSTHKFYSYDLNVEGDNQNNMSSYGDTGEVAIQRCLYDLYDKKINSYDLFCLGLDSIMDIVLSSRPSTFSDFIQAMYQNGYDKFLLGKLLAHYSMSVPSITVSYSSANCPVFEWSTYMGNSLLKYNCFDLFILNSAKNEVIRKNNIYSTEETVKYELSNDDWAKILSGFDNYYYVYIIAKQTEMYTSGFYCSDLFKLQIPENFITRVRIKPNEWGFDPQYFFETNKTNHFETTLSKNNLNIYTNRLRCGYIEDSYVVLSPKRKNAGKAYLELYFDKPIYAVMFSIALWSENEGLYPITCSAVVETLDDYHDWNDDFDLFNDLPNGFSIKDDHFDKYASLYPQGIYGLRFVMTAPATGDRNKGRLCIDEICLDTNPNTRGFSTFSLY